jgi:sulfur carrier protein ThiS
MTQLAVFASPLPFSSCKRKILVLEGSTVDEIVTLSLPQGLQGFDAIAFVNGEPVPVSQWTDLRPSLGDIVTVQAVPQGGGGKKSPIAAIITIAALVAAPYLAPYLAGTAGIYGPLTAAQMASVSFAKAAIGIVGSLAASALSPPPKQPNAGKAVSNAAESPTQFIEGASNTFAPYSVVPVCLGTNRMFPPQAARPFTEASKNDIYVRQIFNWGFGTKLAVSDFQIGETPINEFDDFELAHRLNGDLHLGTSLYSKDVYQEDYNILLKEVDGYTLRTTQPNIDEANIDITFNSGLAEFNKKTGKRLRREVVLQVQYAPTGTSDWSPDINTFSAVSGVTRNINDVPQARVGRNGTATELIDGIIYGVGYRYDLVVIDNYTKSISVVQGTLSFNKDGIDISGYKPPLPANKVKLATVLVRTKYTTSGVRVGVTEIISLSDDRQPSLYGKVLQDSSSFIPTISGNDVAVSSGSIAVDQATFREATAEALRRTIRIKFPESGTYDIRIKRITDDSTEDNIIDECSWTALKSVTYTQPVTLQGINGTAVRIKGSDQLNGTISQFNGVVSNIIPDYDAESDSWVERPTSNPASIYRYCLQGGAIARPIDDSGIDLAKIEEWHAYCKTKGYSYNRVIDYETSLDEVLRDVATAGSASPDNVDGIRTVVIDQAGKEISGMITPRNSWGYSGEINYPELPHALRMQFRNSEKGFVTDEITVYRNGYSASNATLFEAMDLPACTNADEAYQNGIRYFAMAELRPETHSVMMDFENLTFTRGDRVALVNDIPLIGVGDGRIKQVIRDSNNLVVSIEIDDVIEIPTGGIYYLRIRKQDSEQVYKQITNGIGSTQTLDIFAPFEDDDINAEDLISVTESESEQDCIITKIEPSDDLTAKVYLQNYAPEIFDIEDAANATFDSNITTPLIWIRPSPPVLVSSQSNESAMIVTSNGSYISRAIFTLTNTNYGEVTPEVKVRLSGTDTFHNANILEASPDRVILTGLSDGLRYDIHIRYRRAGGEVLSSPLQINNFLFVGADGTPSDVENFRIAVIGENAILSWDSNTDIDLDHYIIKYSALYTGASWATAQVLLNNVINNTVTIPFLGGTYLIKAVDKLDNESANATAIITYDPSGLRNVVEILTESPDFLGVKDEVTTNSEGLLLADPSEQIGYYYFDNSLDLGGVYSDVYLSAAIEATGTYLNNIFTMDDIFAEDDIFGAGNDIFAITDIFAESDIFGIEANSWAVQLQYRITQVDPLDDDWTDWTEFNAGAYSFRAIELRLKLESLSQNITPVVTGLLVTIDMPDRIERGEDLEVTAAGVTITHAPAFKNNPAILITLQDGATDDRIEYTSKTSTGFTFKVYNATSAGFVTRIFDYVASGYGRIQ